MLADPERKTTDREKELGKLQAWQKQLQEEGGRLLSGYESIWKQNLELRIRKAEFEARHDCKLGDVPPTLPRLTTLAGLAVWAGLAALAGLLLLLRRPARRPLWLGASRWIWLGRGVVVVLIVVVISGASYRIANGGNLLVGLSPDPKAERSRVLAQESKDLKARTPATAQTGGSQPGADLAVI